MPLHPCPGCGINKVYHGECYECTYEGPEDGYFETGEDPIQCKSGCGSPAAHVHESDSRECCGGMMCCPTANI